MKKIIRTLIVTLLIISIYLLFEPIFLHNIARKPLPKLDTLKVEYKSQFSKADSILKEEHKRLESPALSMAVGKNDKIIWSNAIGFKDLKNKIKVDSLTKFRIGSTSKAITSAGLGILIQKSKLELGSEVKDFVPYADDNISKLTIAQVASHTSGIRNYGVCFCLPVWEYYNNDKHLSIEESVKIFNHDPLLFTPGTDFSYSSYNYTLLSAVIEGAANDTFLNFMQKNVFDSLNLNNTMADKNNSQIQNVAKFYDIDVNSYKESYRVDNSNKWAGGGLLSTPVDLVKFGNAILNSKLFNGATTQILFEPTRLKNGQVNEQNYALGWRNDISEKILASKRKTRVIHHGGVAMGATALLILLPEYNITVAITMNRTHESFDLFKTAYKIVSLFVADESKGFSPSPWPSHGSEDHQ